MRKKIVFALFFVLIALAVVIVFVVGDGAFQSSSQPKQQQSVTKKGAQPGERVCGAKEIKEIQRQIDEASAQGGGEVQLKGCVLTLEQPLVLKSGVHLKGAGTDKTVLRIKAKDDAGKSMNHNALKTEQGAKNVKISDMTFDGDKQRRRDKIDDPHAHTVVLDHVDGFAITNVHVVNSASGSLVLFNSKNGVIKKSHIKNSGSNGILGLQHTRDVKVVDNVIEGTDEQNGIFFSYQEGKSTSNITIERNKVVDAADFGIEVGHIVAPGDEPHKNIVVRNNEVINSRNAGIAFRTVSDGVIENNTVVGYGQTGGYGGDGIFVEGGYNVATNVQVVKNEVKQNELGGGGNAIYVTGIDGALVEGNTVEGSGGKGLFVEASYLGEKTRDFPDGRRMFNNIRISDNTFNDNAVQGIHVQGCHAKQIAIEGNVVKGNDAHGIQVANIEQGDGLSVANNEVSGNGESGIEIYNQKDFYVRGNTIANNNQSVATKRGKAAVTIFHAGEGEVVGNMFVDDQERVTQAFAVRVENEMGKIKVDRNELKGGTKEYDGKGRKP